MADPKVEPTLPAGMNDYGPAQMTARDRMLQIIATVYRRFGFVPLQTSILQRRMVLTGGEESHMKLWSARPDGSTLSTDQTVQIAMRFDLTVPLARYVAEHIGELKFPFRRYEMGYVFRGEKPQAGRFNGFMQFDADIVGAPTGPADAEVVWCMIEVMTALGFDRFEVRLNTRRILNGLMQKLGIEDANGAQAKGVIRVIDKLDKIGAEGVLAELRNGEPEATAFVDGLLDDEQTQIVRAFLELAGKGKSNDQVLAELRQFFGTDYTEGVAGVAELEQINALLVAASAPRKWVIDPTVARGLAYYSGPVFETILLDAPEFGSVYSGGRFDYLVARFTGESLPSVGASVGVDRLFDAMEHLGLVDAESPQVDVFIIDFDAKLRAQYFALAKELRDAGVRVEIGMSYQETSFKGQLAIGLKRNAPLILIMGEREAQSGQVTIKLTGERRQETVPRAGVVASVLTLLKNAV